VVGSEEGIAVLGADLVFLGGSISSATTFGRVILPLAAVAVRPSRASVAVLLRSELDPP
jgi:hypothetical protein